VIPLREAKILIFVPNTNTPLMTHSLKGVATFDAADLAIAVWEGQPGRLYARKTEISVSAGLCHRMIRVKASHKLCVSFYNVEQLY